METQSSQPAVREALTTVQQFLSDSIPPLLAADSIILLIRHPPELVASEIRAWISLQFQGSGDRGSISDYIFHAIKKLDDMGRLKLVPRNTLSEYLQKLMPLAAEFCPEDERDLLFQNLEALGNEDTALAAPVAFIHRQVKNAEVSRGDLASESGRRSRRFSLLLERLQHEAAPAPVDSATKPDKQAEQVSQVIATAAANAQSSSELQELQKVLSSFGIKSGTDHVFRRLGHSLPGWVVPVRVEADAGTPLPLQNPVVEAMSQFLKLAENKRECGKRLQELLQAAIEQFNAGSLARAVTMLELADHLISESEIKPDTAAFIREDSHESLDSNRLRACAETPEKHHLLRRVLNFFPPLRPQSLLDSLESEAKRDRRRLLLSLLEAHGTEARVAAFERLEAVVASSDVSRQWYFPRNLICILNRIPRLGDESPDREITLMGLFLKPALAMPLIREAMTDLAQIKHESAEQLLIAMLNDLEKRLQAHGSTGSDPATLKLLLDRAIFLLSHYGTAKAYRAVINHGLKRQEELGDTLARLSYLSGQDLSIDEESVARLVSAVRARIPMKLLGMVIQKSSQGLMHLIRALSSTPNPGVQGVLEEIASRFPEQEFGKAASKALQGLTFADQQADAPTERLLGDLELFSLPDLLQQLVRSKLTGTLNIKDQKGEVVGTLSMRFGQMEGCVASLLENEEALYQLLEKPVPGTFVFLGRHGQAAQDFTEAPLGRDILPLILEGMRRHDELQRARALVPDSCSLKSTGTEPAPRPGEDDPAFSDQLWTKIVAGATPEECEASFHIDSYKVRCLLARWVEEASLTIC